MSDISPISPVSTGRIEPVADRPGPRTAPTPRSERPSDRVELSDRARYLSKLAALPEVRLDLVDRVRREIAAGSYETDAKLDAAIRNLVEDLDH